MTVSLILFFVLAAIAIGAAIAMLLTRNAVYAALYLIVNFVTVAIFYLTLNAPFIAISQVTVYAGAIMVLFLFVIMLLGAERSGAQPGNVWFQRAAWGLGLVMLVEIVYVLVTQAGQMAAAGALPDQFGEPLQIGQELFTQYLLPFEVTSILLLVAMVGAIFMTRSDMKRS